MNVNRQYFTLRIKYRLASRKRLAHLMVGGDIPQDGE